MNSVSFYFAGAALVVSLVALWKTHFAGFSPTFLVGTLRHRIYPIKSENERWFMSSFDVPIGVTNGGARLGLVTSVRLVLRFPSIPIPDAREVMYPKWTLEPADANKIDKNRFKWIDELCLLDWMSIVILPKATVVRHIIFESRWQNEVVQNEVHCTLEVSCGGSNSWVQAAEWSISLKPSTWSMLVSGAAHCYRSRQEIEASSDDIHPPDLHKYTGTREPLGKSKPHPPSYLDFKDDERE